MLRYLFELAVKASESRKLEDCVVWFLRQL